MQKKRWMFRIVEIILIFLILSDILDFFDILPGDIDYISLIVTWASLGYLLYRASLTRVFFNSRRKLVDILLISSYFMLVLKNLIQFSSGRLEEYAVFYGFQKFIVDNSASLELYFFVAGSVAILLLAVYSALSISIKKPSLMHIIHEEGKPKNLYRLMVRIITIYLVYIAFFIVVFNLAMEWIGISVDAPILMIGLLLYIFVVARHRKYRAESLVFKIGEFGMDFYKKYVSLFHDKNTILLGISGMLVLHLLTDALSFIIPYILVFRDILYFSHLGPGHDALMPLFLQQISGQPALEVFSLFFVYLLNIMGILLLLLLPSLLWYMAFSEKKVHISNFKVSLIITSVAVFIIAPVFRISRLQESPIVGVDIKTGFAQNLLFSDFFQVLFFAFILSAAIILLLDSYKKYFVHFILLKIIIFFMYYIYLFATSLFLYYIGIIAALFAASRLILSFYFLIFFAISILFYLVGFIMFVDELVKEKIYKKIL
ncbi:hypothetical protein HYU09_00730 [Candidatus Woesearchaeota archaeon]|nr:hypothetical protein [Candidatus Woesearchaeota archaeon]